MPQTNNYGEADTEYSYKCARRHTSTKGGIAVIQSAAAGWRKRGFWFLEGKEASSPAPGKASRVPRFAYIRALRLQLQHIVLWML